MNKKYIFSPVIICCISLFFSACTPKRPDTDPSLDKKALVLARQVQSFNKQIVSSKGTGWIRVKTETKHEKFKIAWAAVFPNKIRVTFLISANPIETIIATGEKITFISHTGQHKIHSYKAKDPDMKKYISVPIKMSEMILFLLGRLPVNNFDDAYFEPSDPSLSTIVLEQKEEHSIQSFHFNDKKECDSMWKENFSRKLIYKTLITKYKKYDLNNIPIQVIIKDNNGRKLFLEITNFILNPSIKESIFQLTE